MAKFLNSTGLATFLVQLKSFFATTVEVGQVKEDTSAYVLNVDYESLLAFDIAEIVTSEDDVILEENESLLLSSDDSVLVDANNTYIIVERGE